MGQSGSTKLKKGASLSEVTKEIDIAAGQFVIKTALIVIGEPQQQTMATTLRLCLENTDAGRVKVSDLEDVEKSEGENFDEKLSRYLKQSTGVVLMLSHSLKDCIDEEKIVQVDINNTKLLLNGKLVNEILQDEKLNKKFIPVSSSKDKLPKALDNHKLIAVPDGEVDDAVIEKVAEELRPMLEGFHHM
eukprot:gene20039-22005_t